LQNAGIEPNMRVGRLTTEVKMPVGAIERDIQDACVRLAESAALARRCGERYLDGLGGPPGVAGRDLGGRDLMGTALTEAHPWALGGFGDRVWDGYQPDPHAPPPDGLRVDLLPQCCVRVPLRHFGARTNEP
jgi:hypothetical protein